MSYARRRIEKNTQFSISRFHLRSAQKITPHTTRRKREPFSLPSPAPPTQRRSAARDIPHIGDTQGVPQRTIPNSTVFTSPYSPPPPLLRKHPKRQQTPQTRLPQAKNCSFPIPALVRVPFTMTTNLKLISPNTNALFFPPLPLPRVSNRERHQMPTSTSPIGIVSPRPFSTPTSTLLKATSFSQRATHSPSRLAQQASSNPRFLPPPSS